MGRLNATTTMDGSSPRLHCKALAQYPLPQLYPLNGKAECDDYHGWQLPVPSLQGTSASVSLLRAPPNITPFVFLPLTINGNTSVSNKSRVLFLWSCYVMAHYARRNSRLMKLFSYFFIYFLISFTLFYIYSQHLIEVF